MGLTGYTCHDLYHTLPLQRAAEAALATRDRREARKSFAASRSSGCRWSSMANSSMPPRVIHAGKLLGVVPKAYLPNYKEFYDARYFAPAANAVVKTATIPGDVQFLLLLWQSQYVACRWKFPCLSYLRGPTGCTYLC